MDKLRFLHIPKTAGTTITRILHKQYRGKKVFRFIGDNPLDKKRFSELGRNEKEAIRLFTGHAPFITGIPEADGIPTITFLRDPLKRVKSFCQHVSEGKSPHLLESFPPDTFTLDEFLFSGNSELSNLQSRMLINYEKTESGELLIERMSPLEIKEQALANLFEKVTSFGLQEYFDESLILFATVLGWRMPVYQTINQKDRRHLLKFEDHHIEKMIELNAIDIEFYQEARNRFLNIISSEHYNKNKLKTFKLVQRIASPMLQIYGSTKLRAMRQLRSIYNR